MTKLPSVLMLLPLLVSALLAFSSCNSNTPSPLSDPNLSDTNHVEIYIDRYGKIIVDGKESSLKSLEKTLIDLEKKQGTVWYNRANPTEDAPEEGQQVMELVVKYNLSLHFFKDKNFTQPFSPLKH